VPPNFFSLRSMRQALGEILGRLFPVKWKFFQTAEGGIGSMSN